MDSAIFSGLDLPNEMACRMAGRELAGLLPEDCVLCLTGELGAGKTTLVRGVAEGLGIAAVVKSPTYNYYMVYEGREGRQLVHFDAYRVNSEEGYHSLLVEDLLRSPWVMAVEWADRVLPWLPRPCWAFHLSDNGTGGRRLDWRGVVS